jgi:hypothetical protein
MKTIHLIAFVCLLALSATAEKQAAVPLFPEDGPPKGWLVRDWADVANPATEGAAWEVKDGVLHGSNPRGTWLVSIKEYGDFELKYDFMLGDQGNSGCGLRFPLKGDPAFDGLEMQMCDPRYYGDYKADAWELAGALYKGMAPTKQVYKPGEWNTCAITCIGASIKIVMNGTTIIDANLDEETRLLERGSPLKDRPRKGHIGFQELSRGSGHVMIRNAWITELPAE